MSTYCFVFVLFLASFCFLACCVPEPLCFSSFLPVVDVLFLFWISCGVVSFSLKLQNFCWTTRVSIISSICVLQTSFITVKRVHTYTVLSEPCLCFTSSCNFSFYRSPKQLFPSERAGLQHLSLTQHPTFCHHGNDLLSLSKGFPSLTPNSYHR